jgi:polyhydroxyalkanoate synthesis repressor PhaR
MVHRNNSGRFSGAIRSPILPLCNTKEGDMLVKKYSNRRLYDTDASRYITIEELAAKVQAGSDIRVVDAKSGADLTQATLVQIILEGRGAAAMLPVSLLVQLIRLGDEALGEFLGRYMATSLEMYLQAKQGVQSLLPMSPFGPGSFSPAEALARMWGSSLGWSQQPPAARPAVPTPPPAPPSVSAGVPDDVAALRRELDEIKLSLRKRSKK